MPVQAATARKLKDNFISCRLISLAICHHINSILVSAAATICYYKDEIRIDRKHGTVQGFMIADDLLYPPLFLSVSVFLRMRGVLSCVLLACCMAECTEEELIAARDRVVTQCYLCSLNDQRLLARKTYLRNIGLEIK